MKFLRYRRNRKGTSGEIHTKVLNFAILQLNYNKYQIWTNTSQTTVRRKTSSLEKPQVTPHPVREKYLPNYGYFPVSP